VGGGGYGYQNKEPIGVKWGGGKKKTILQYEHKTKKKGLKLLKKRGRLVGVLVARKKCAALTIFFRKEEEGTGFPREKGKKVIYPSYRFTKMVRKEKRST